MQRFDLRKAMCFFKLKICLSLFQAILLCEKKSISFNKVFFDFVIVLLFFMQNEIDHFINALFNHYFNIANTKRDLFKNETFANNYNSDISFQSINIHLFISIFFFKFSLRILFSYLINLTNLNRAISMSVDE